MDLKLASNAWNFEYNTSSEKKQNKTKDWQTKALTENTSFVVLGEDHL